MGSEKIRERAVKACIKYLELLGREILEGEYEGFIVAKDEDQIAFVDVVAGIGYFKEFCDRDAACLRDSFEKAIVDYFSENEGEPDIQVRLDKIAISIVADDRAVLKHFVNVCCD